MTRRELSELENGTHPELCYEGESKTATELIAAHCCDVLTHAREIVRLAESDPEARFALEKASTGKSEFDDLAAILAERSAR